MNFVSNCVASDLMPRSIFPDAACAARLEIGGDGLMVATSNSNLAGVCANSETQKTPKKIAAMDIGRNIFIILLLRFYGISITGACQKAAF